MTGLPMTELPMTELPMTELPMTVPPMKEYDGGALSEDERLRAAALAYTWYAQQQLWRILGMRSSSFCAYLVCAAAAFAHTKMMQKLLMRTLRVQCSLHDAFPINFGAY